VAHEPMHEISAGEAHTVTAKIVTPAEPEAVDLHVWAGARPEVIKMTRENGYTYTATIPAERVQTGFLRYFITVKENGKHFTFPSGNETHPFEWDFYGDDGYRVSVLPEKGHVYLFNAATDSDQLLRQWVRGSAVMPTGHVGQAEVIVNIEQLFREDPEDKYKERIYDYTMKYYFGRKVSAQIPALASAT